MLTHLLPTTPLDLLLHLSLAGLLLLTPSTLLTTTLLRRSSAATRHLTWTAACLALLCLPAFSLLPANNDLPPYLTPLPRLTASLPTFPTSPPSALPTPPPPQPSLSFSSLLLPLYVLGLLPSLTPLLLSPLLLRRLKRHSTLATDPALLSALDTCRHTLNVTRPTTLLLSPSPTTMPLTFGPLRPHILLPSDAPTWPTPRLTLVLSHELAHIKRHDCLTHTLAQLARALHWFNPLAHYAVARMRSERERACDDLVLRTAPATRPSDYADTLLHLATTLRPAPSLLPAMPMARGPSHLHTRLRAILDPALNRSPLSRRLTLAILLLSPLIALPLSCTHAPPKPQSATTQPTAAAGPNAPWPPDLTACARNLRDLSAALLDYADTHDRHYPPDLGPTVDFIARRAAQSAPDHHPPTPAELAHKFLCPLRAPTAFIPDQVTADWVRFNSTYTYLGSDKLSVGDFTEDQWDHTVILHDDLDHPHHHPYFGTVTIVAYLNGSAQLLPVDEARKQIATSKQTLAVIDYHKIKALQNRTRSTPNPRHSATSPLRPQSSALNPETAPRPLPFDLGDASFLPGDSITITQILDVTPPAITSSHVYQVAGHYTLASHDRATLGCYVTSSDPNSGKGSTALVAKGTAIPFSLNFTLSGNGHPHLSFYPSPHGPSFGSLYFDPNPTPPKHPSPTH